MTPALACLLAWSAGVATTTVVLPGQPLVGAVALAGAALGTALALALRPALLGLALTAALLGAARAELPPPDPKAPAAARALAGTQALVEGTVVDDPRLLDGGFEVLVFPHRLLTSSGPHTPAGNVLARVRAGPEPEVGDSVEVLGRLDLPRQRPDLDRRAYLAQRGAHLEMRTAQLRLVSRGPGVRSLPARLRDSYREAVQTLLPPPHAQVLVGVVLGVRTGIPLRLRQDLIATGLVHLLVLSGLKVAVFARLARGALFPLLGKAATLPALALIALYALAGGATPAAVRAASMGALALVAAHLGRPTHVWTSLGAAAAAMLAWRPELAWDVGFQLSFAGTAAIVLLTPGIERRLPWMPGWLREPFAVTCAAQVGTVPFMASGFHLLSPVAPLANAAVLPLLPAMVAGGLLVAPLAALPELGRLVALPLAGLLTYLEQVAGLLARLPAASVPAPNFSAPVGAAYYALLGGVVAGAQARGRVRSAAFLAGAAVPLLVGLAELAVWARPAAAATVLPVGAGQAVLLSGPSGTLLVDGGPSPARLAAELGARLPPWQRRLSGLVITGPGLGHVGGLAGLGYGADLVVVPEGGLTGSAGRAAAFAQVATGARLLSMRAGQRLSVAGLDLEALAPEPSVLEPGQLALLVRGPSGRTFCDLADLAPEEQVTVAARLASEDQRCDWMLLPGRGQSAPVPELLRAARPGRLVLSDPGGGSLARDLPVGWLSRTSEEGAVAVPL